MLTFGQLREEKSGFRVKKEGPIHVVFLGPKHIGNIIEPTFGNAKGKALKHTAMTKNWGIKSTHDSKHSAMEWLKNKHKSNMSTRVTEGMEATITGTTPYGRQNTSIAKQRERVNKKDPASLLTLPKSDSQNSVSEAFLRVYNEAKNKLEGGRLTKPDAGGLKDKELTDNGYSVDEPNPQMKKIAKNAFQIKKTDTGEDGAVITIDPNVKEKPGNPDNITPDHKSKPNPG